MKFTNKAICLAFVFLRVSSHLIEMAEGLSTTSKTYRLRKIVKKVKKSANLNRRMKYHYQTSGEFPFEDLQMVIGKKVNDVTQTKTKRKNWGKK